MTSPMLKIESLEVQYGKAKSLHGVSLSVDSGKMIAIVGPVGAGKSTLMDAIFGLNSSEGIIEFEGQNLRGLSPPKNCCNGDCLRTRARKFVHADERQRQSIDRCLHIEKRDQKKTSN